MWLAPDAYIPWPQGIGVWRNLNLARALLHQGHVRVTPGRIPYSTLLDLPFLTGTSAVPTHFRYFPGPPLSFSEFDTLYVRHAPQWENAQGFSSFGFDSAVRKFRRLSESYMHLQCPSRVEGPFSQAFGSLRIPCTIKEILGTDSRCNVTKDYFV